jgi:hypothetical protein
VPNRQSLSDPQGHPGN